MSLGCSKGYAWRAGKAMEKACALMKRLNTSPEEVVPGVSTENVRPLGYI